MQLVFEFSLVVKLKKTLSLLREVQSGLWASQVPAAGLCGHSSQTTASYPEMRGRSTAVPRVAVGQTSPRKAYQTVSNPQWHMEDTGHLQHLCAPGPPRPLCRTATTDGQPSITVSSAPKETTVEWPPPTGSLVLLSHLHLRKTTAEWPPPMGSPVRPHLHPRKPSENSHYRRAAQHYHLIYTWETTTLTRLRRISTNSKLLSNPRALLQSTPQLPQLNPSVKWRESDCLISIVHAYPKTTKIRHCPVEVWEELTCRRACSAEVSSSKTVITATIMPREERL